MNGRFSPYQVNAWVQKLVDRTIYMTLFVTDPFTAHSPLAAELSAAASSRQPSVWTMASTGYAVLANDIVFRSIPAETTIVAVGGFDASVNGNLLFRDLVSSDERVMQPIYMGGGGTFSIAAGQMAIGLDV